jgi:hypothetical protein
VQMGGAHVRNLDDLVSVMQRHLRKWDDAQDQRATFLRVYITMTNSVNAHLHDGYFLDPPWIERVAVRFASYYFDAFERFESGERAPPSWSLAFTNARERKGFVLQDILLGMNAHINNDLAQVMAEILREEGDTHSLRRRFDHNQINRVLDRVIPRVETEVASHYGRLIQPLGTVMGSLDRALATFGLITWRDNVWQNAQFLLAAQNEAERRLVVSVIEEDALHVAQQIDRFPLLHWCRPLAPYMRRWRLC